MAGDRAPEGARLFGTDGVRGRANVDLTPELALDLARAAGEGRNGTVLIGRDPRRSGQMLASALHAGFHSVGLDTIDAGIVPTGAVSFLTRSRGALLGTMVSASHNPAPDNGIKFFGRDGAKLTDAAEAQIEARLAAGHSWRLAEGRLVGLQQRLPDALDRYVSHLASGMPYSLRGMELALDCANGAAARAAPDLFDRLGADVAVYAAEPDGMNINDGCGATHPGFLARLARGRLGLAFDGDADRLVAVDEAGVPANGDVVMAVIARHLKDTGKLDGNTVVVTVMSNLGFLRAMEDLDIDVVVTDVGDRYVLEAMRERGAVLGGEQSGHVIGADRITGDGLATALGLLGVMAATGQPLTDLRTVMTEYPQVIRNVQVLDRNGLDTAGGLWASVAEVERKLGRRGRVLVRASGTEPVVRIMVEASSAPEAAAEADHLAGVVRAELGVA